jgi:2'-5' RNA ligase
VPQTVPAATLHDHWQWRPEWACDRACVLWYVTFESQPELSCQASLAHERLRRLPLVDVVPLPWLHLTVDDVGFADELSPRELEDVVAAARAAVAGWVAPPLSLGPIRPMEDSVVLQAGPAAELGDLRDRLRSATSAVRGPEAVSGLDAFWPHVTLAYLNDACSSELVMEPLGPLCDARLVVAAPRLTLASVTRQDRHYQWTALAELPLVLSA